MSSKDVNDFNDLVELAMKQPGHKNMRPVIEKELLHYDLLFALDEAELLDELTFQGGSALRLCYGAGRYSEDLDFAGGKDFKSSDLSDIKECVEQYVGNRYELHITVMTPSEVAQDPRFEGIKTDHWIIRIETSPKRPDIPKQQINIQIANIPAYTREPKALHINYDFLPDGYGDTIVLTESLDEIMADKIIAFVNTTKYIRHRDIWDLRWLKSKGAELNMGYVTNKIEDYRVTNFSQQIGDKILHLSEIIDGDEFQNQMTRFLLTDELERTLQKEKFREYLKDEMAALFSEVREKLT